MALVPNEVSIVVIMSSMNIEASVTDISDVSDLTIEPSDLLDLL